MIVILYDIAEGEYKDYFTRQYSSDTRADKKWPGVYRQPMEGKSLPYFKGLITSIEASNSGYRWNWDEKSLADRLFGGVFGREEYYSMNKGDYVFTTKCASVRNVDTIRKGIEAPKDKLADRTQRPAQAASGSSFGAIGTEIPTLADDDLPF